MVLLELPIEILEHIAASLREPAPVLEAASRYIDDRYSDFSQARFTLSAFSKVSSSLRKAVERILYRDVQLDFTGWKGRKHTKWPAGSLRLLLRTLEERPDLGRFIYAAALDYQLSTESSALEDGLELFLELTPNLRTLFLGQCPLALWDFPLLKTLTFATTFAPGILPSILEQFPKLQNLYLRDCHVMGFSVELPPHNLHSVRFDSSHDQAVAHFSRALSVCSDTVHHLDIRFLGGLLQPSPMFARRHPGLIKPPATNLRSLRLDNLSVFSHVDSAYAQLLQSLPALQELRITNHTCFLPDAFSILPPSLRKLTISDYYGYWEPRSPYHEVEHQNFNFLMALSKAMTMSTRKIASVVAATGRGNHSLDLASIATACTREHIENYTEIEENDAFVEITCTCLMISRFDAVPNCFIFKFGKHSTLDYATALSDSLARFYST